MAGNIYTWSIPWKPAPEAVYEPVRVSDTAWRQIRRYRD